ncbi:MAG: hypothetical protein ACXV5Q_16165 [Frankiaceae bacterium]
MSALVPRLSFGAVVAVAVFVIALTGAAVNAGSAMTSHSGSAPASISAAASSRTATPTKIIQTGRFSPRGHRWS